MASDVAEWQLHRRRGSLFLVTACARVLVCAPVRLCAKRGAPRLDLAYAKLGLRRESKPLANEKCEKFMPNAGGAVASPSRSQSVADRHHTSGVAAVRVGKYC